MYRLHVRRFLQVLSKILEILSVTSFLNVLCNRVGMNEDKVCEGMNKEKQGEIERCKEKAKNIYFVEANPNNVCVLNVLHLKCFSGILLF